MFTKINKKCNFLKMENKYDDINNIKINLLTMETVNYGYGGKSGKVFILDSEEI